MTQPPPAPGGGREPYAALPGIVLIVSALAALFAVAHHPVVSRARDDADVLAQVVRLRAVDQAVHAVVIAAAVGLVFGLVAFALRRGMDRNAVLGGTVAFAIGTVGAVAAGAIDGFLIPAIAARYATAPAAQVAVAVQMLAACALAIQVFTKLWLLAGAVAVALWSIDLLRARGPARIVGIAGLTIGAASAAFALLGGSVSAHALGILVLVQAAWYVAVGALMTGRARNMA